MNWQYLGALLRRQYQLFLGFERDAIVLKTGTLTYTAESGQCIYAFVSLSAANTITTATSMDDVVVLVGDVPPQGYEVKMRLKSIAFSGITGTVLVYVKNIKDPLASL